MTELTPRQAEVLQWIKQFQVARGYPPSRRDLCKAFGFRLNAAHGFIKILVRKGRLLRDPGKARSFTIPSLQNSIPIINPYRDADEPGPRTAAVREDGQPDDPPAGAADAL